MSDFVEVGNHLFRKSTINHIHKFNRSIRNKALRLYSGIKVN